MAGDGEKPASRRVLAQLLGADVLVQRLARQVDVEEQQLRYAEWRRLLQTVIAAIAGKQAAPEPVLLLVDLVAGAIDGLGIQAVLEPSRFPAQHLAAAVDALVDLVASHS